MHLQIAILDDQSSAGSQAEGAVHCDQSLTVQAIVAVGVMPPLTIVAVGDVKLRSRVAGGRVGA